MRPEHPGPTPSDDLLLDEPDTPLPVRPGTTTGARVITVERGRTRQAVDQLATEEPLEIRIVVAGESHPVTITMRTPGADFELAAGFLHSEQVIGSAGDIHRITYCMDRSVDAVQRYNIVNVVLRDGVAPDLRPLERTFHTTSACGVCGKARLDALHMRSCAPLPPGPTISAAVVSGLPDALREAQRLFAATGGLHAAGLFDAAGRLIVVREDVGRHNAVDKVLGWALLQHRLPLHDHLLMVSGRTSYEILQKAVVAGVPVVCAVSAPSSLAVALAKQFGVTLIGFLRGDRFNIYSRADRLAPDSLPSV